MKQMIAVTGRNPSDLDNLKKYGVTGCHHHNRGSPFNRGTKYKYLLTESILTIRAAETRVQTYYTLLAQWGPNPLIPSKIWLTETPVLLIVGW
jgi:hypothetical protein